ncbi:TonB family protein [Filimonas zeae]|nr:energy transducer TonB [Filimonas zeae]MDR6337593.1 TonB family protein [Filimonas zeae]
MMRLLLVWMLLFFASAGFAQKDTVYRYRANGRRATGNDSITTIQKLVKNADGTWHMYAYKYAGNRLDYDEPWADTIKGLVDGVSRSYYESGATSDSTIYKNGRRKLQYHYYKNGALMALAHYNNAGDFTSVEGWDSTGKVIPDFIFMQQASFPGGDKGWGRYLGEQLGRKQPKAFQKGEIGGAVVVSFLVNKEGHVTEVAIDESSGYQVLDQHALNVIKNSPDWNPAIQYNQPVIYRQKQKLTYTN